MNTVERAVEIMAEEYAATPWFPNIEAAREFVKQNGDGIAIKAIARALSEKSPIKVAEVVKNRAGQVHVDWLGGMVIDHVGESLYIIKSEAR